MGVDAMNRTTAFVVSMVLLIAGVTIAIINLATAQPPWMTPFASLCTIAGTLITIRYSPRQEDQ
jgi:hypothetical protein